MGGDLTKKWCSFCGRGANASGDTYSVSSLCVDNIGIVYMSGMTTSDTIQRPTIQTVTMVYKDSVRNAREGLLRSLIDQSLYHAHYFGGSNDDVTLVFGSRVRYLT